MEEIVPDEIQNILTQFPDVFATPTTLPSQRACDHNIPLIPGA
jgi:hypothetical protein